MGQRLRMEYMRNGKIFEGLDNVAEETGRIDKRQQSSPSPGNLSVFKIIF